MAKSDSVDPSVRAAQRLADAIEKIRVDSSMIRDSKEHFVQAVSIIANRSVRDCRMAIIVSKFDPKLADILLRQAIELETYLNDRTEKSGR